MMDMLFRLVSFQFQQEPQTPPQPQQYHHQQQHQSYDDDNNNHYYYKNNNSSNSSSSRSSKQTHHYYYQNPHYYYPHHQDEESFNFLMDDEDFSSSSSHTNKQQHHHHYPYYAQSSTTPTHYGGGGVGASFESSSSATANFSYTPARDLSLELFSSSSSSSSSFPGPTKWASELLLETARAVSDRNTERLHQLHWMLNEVGSPYGDVEQKLACYFSQALFARMTDAGDRCSRTMRAAVDKSTSFDSTRKMILKFQEVSPWTTFGHVACNGALIDAFEGETKVHIIDFSSTFCTQWPTLLEAVATRMDEPPKLTITTVVVNKSSEIEGGGSRRVMREIGTRLEKFARLMGVPFKFNVVYHTGDFSELDLTRLDINDDEALAVNCVNSLHSVNVNRRDDVVSMFRRLNPRVVTVVEEEAGLVDLGPDGFGFGFEFGECLRWFRVYFEALEESFPRTSNEKLMLERAAGRALLDLLACPGGDSSERRELAGRWSARMMSAGFCHVAFSDEVCDDVRALLRRYKEGWAMAQGSGDTSAAGIFLSWRDEPVVWASAWKP